MVFPVTTTTLTIMIVVMLLCISFSGYHAQSISNTVNEGEDHEIPSSATGTHQVENPLRSYLSRGGRLPNNANNRDLSNVREALLSGNLERFTPPPVTDPTCHVDIQVVSSETFERSVQRVPGRCIRIANGLPACQTEHWLSINTDECS